MKGNGMTKRMMMASIAVLCALAAWGAERPELYAFPFKTEIGGAGEYAAEGVGCDFVLSGNIEGDVELSGKELYRVTLSNATVAGTLALAGDAQLWLVGENRIESVAASAIVAGGALTVGGAGSLAASAPGGKKTGVVSTADLTLAGGDTVLTIANPTAKNACGVSLSGNYVQLAGSLSIVGESGDVKQNGVFLSKKKTAATISGGTLSVTLAGEKSVGLALDKDTASAEITGGVLRFAMSGDGAKGIKGDGAIAMSGGLLEATLTGGYAEDCYSWEDDDEVEWFYTVTLASTNKTSGGTSAYATTSLIANGTYPVMDPSKSYAVKGGTVAISGGTVRIRATGTAGRGIGGDSLSISGGAFDISVSGGPTDVYVQMLSSRTPQD